MADARGIEPAVGPVGVLHVINGEFYAGAERVQGLLADALSDFGYRTHFVCLKQGEFQRALEQGPHPVQLAVMRSRADVVGRARAIAQHARATGCRLLHSHTPRSALVAALASYWSGLPLVHHVHSPTSRDSAHRLRNAVNAAVERAVLGRAQRLLPVSQSLAQYLREHGYPADRIVTIPNGVAVEPGPAVSVPHRPGRLTIGTVALFRPRKGIEVLLRALARLVRDGLDVQLLAVGPFETAEYERSVKTLCRELGIDSRVSWPGFRRDVTAELRRMDLLALPSLFGEGMPMVVLEAMAVGLPVVGTRVEGVPEVIREGIEGVLVEPGDEVALAGAVARLAAEPQALARMGAAGRQRQREVYSDQAMARRVAEVYDQLLGLPAGRRRTPARNEEQPTAAAQLR